MIHIRNADIRDIPLIRQIAYAVWPQTYADILTPEQTDYMLKMMYSEAALENQILQQHHQFIIAYTEKTSVGFASWSLLNERKIYRLHKIYVLQDQQGLGVGKKLIEQVAKAIPTDGVGTLELNVNRNNKALDFYLRQGFNIIREEDIDIGHGFFMNDYVMQKIIVHQKL